MSLYPDEVLGTIFQFSSELSIAKLTASSQIPNIYLKFHHFDNIKRFLQSKHIFNSGHLAIIKKNQNISFETLFLFTVLVGDVEFVEKNLNKISRKCLYRAIKCVCFCDLFNIAKILLKHFHMLYNTDCMDCMDCYYVLDDARDGIFFLRNLVEIASTSIKTQFLILLLKEFPSLTQTYIDNLLYHAKEGNKEVLKVFLDLVGDGYIETRPKTFDFLLFDSIKKEKPDIAYLIINHPKLHFNGSRWESAGGLKLATRYGYTDIVKIFLRDGRETRPRLRGGKEGTIDINDNKRFNIETGIDIAFCTACQNDKVDIVKVILENSNLIGVLAEMDTSYKKSELWSRSEFTKKNTIFSGLKKAVKNNRIAVIKTLLEYKAFHPDINNCFMIRTAAKLGHYEIVYLIYKDGRGVPRGTPPKSRLRTFLNKIKAREKKLLKTSKCVELV